MILTDSEIKKQLDAGRIEIAPFNPDNLGSNSYDVTLNENLLIFTGDHFNPAIDQSKDWTKHKIDKGGFLLMPNKCYLGVTNERTNTPHHYPKINGKSSIGRNFISIHQTAGDGDVGFNGYWTLEITVKMPTVIYPNMKIGQISFWKVVGECENSYQQKKDASYKEQYAKAEPVPSKLYKKEFFKNINSK